MAITFIQMDFAGQSGIHPRRGVLLCTDTLDQVTAVNYLQPEVNSGEQFYSSDFIFVSYSGGNGIFQPIMSGGNITLENLSNDGAQVALPVFPNHFAVFTDTIGTISDAVSPAIHASDIQAGDVAKAGGLISVSASVNKGYVKYYHTANTGNTAINVTNAAFGQATNLIYPDPAAANANFMLSTSSIPSGNIVKASATTGVIQDAGYKILYGIASGFGGGGTSFMYTVAGVTSSSIVTANIASLVSPAVISSIACSTNSLVGQFSADPGAGSTIQYMVIVPN